MSLQMVIVKLHSELLSDFTKLHIFADILTGCSLLVLVFHNRVKILPKGFKRSWKRNSHHEKYGEEYYCVK